MPANRGRGRSAGTGNALMFHALSLPGHGTEGCVLKSRATDETGYIQPERDVLIKERGREGYFHYNAIVCWAIDEDGRSAMSMRSRLFHLGNADDVALGIVAGAAAAR